MVIIVFFFYFLIFFSIFFYYFLIDFLLIIFLFLISRSPTLERNINQIAKTALSIRESVHDVKIRVGSGGVMNDAVKHTSLKEECGCSTVVCRCLCCGFNICFVSR